MIIATCGEVSDTCHVTVLPIEAEQVVLSQEEITLFIGATDTLTATVLPENATNKAVTWTTSDDKVATVTDEGLVKAVGAGEAIITATCDSVSATCTVTVKKLSQTIIWNAVPDTLIVGDTLLVDVHASSGLEVTCLLTNGDDLATLQNGVLRVSKPGTITILAQQAGDATYSAATAIGRTITIVPRVIDAIGGVAANDDGIYYNLNGQRVRPPLKRGVYIRNGQRVWVK